MRKSNVKWQLNKEKKEQVMLQWLRNSIKASENIEREYIKNKLKNNLYLYKKLKIMGRGDRKSKKGKIFKGTYGVVRARKKNQDRSSCNNARKK